MRPYPCFAAVLGLALPAAAWAQQPSADRGNHGQLVRKLPLRFVPPSRMMELLNLQSKASQSVQGPARVPTDLDEVSADDASGVLNVRGTSERIGELAHIVNLLDVAPRRIRLRVRLEQVGSRTVVGEATFSTLNNWPVTETFGTEDGVIALRVWPRINGDDSISLHIGLSTEAAGQPGSGSPKLASVNRRIPTGADLVCGIVVERGWAGGEARIRILPPFEGAAGAHYMLTVTPLAIGARQGPSAGKR